MARGTPFHPRTQALCSSLRWKEWAGYFVVNAFDTFHDPEYHAVRSGAALIDVSPLYKYNFVGPDATALTDRLITRNVKRSRIGQVLYSGWCDERGKLLQDGCFQRFATDFVRATAVDPALVWFERVAAGMDVRIEEVSEELGALALQGPTSCQILNVLADADLSDLSDLGFFRLREVRLGGIPVVVTRTGYTGDLGYELWVDREAGGRPLGPAARGGRAPWPGAGGNAGARPGARRGRLPPHRGGLLERGLRAHRGAKVHALRDGTRLGGEREEGTVHRPGTAHGRTGPRAERFFVGIETSIMEIERLFALDDLAPDVGEEVNRDGVPLYSGGQQVGRATSICWSPLLKRQLALATVQRGYEAPGTPLDIEVTVEYTRRRARSRVAAMPFFDPPRKRATPAAG